LPTEDPKLDQLKRLLGENDDLRKAATLLFWDQRVMMPPGGAEARADALATVSRLTHERFVDDELGNLLEDLKGLEETLDYESDDASLIRVTRRDFDKAVRVPPELTGEMRRASALASADWGLAKTFLLTERFNLQFRWDTFNVTNTPSYDVQFLDTYPDRAATFGRYYNTIATCDGGAGRCMQFALRYEF